MMPSVYLETTIPSYLTAWRSPELATAAKQQLTRQWWDERRQHFDLFISETVLLEASRGDPEAVPRRLEVLEDVSVLDQMASADEIAASLIKDLMLPERALADAAHIAICIVHRIEYLLTWNCTHIANATYQPIIREIAEKFGYSMPVICTPEQLLGAVDDS